MRTISQTPRKKSPPQALRVFLILPENNEMTQEHKLSFQEGIELLQPKRSKEIYFLSDRETAY